MGSIPQFPDKKLAGIYGIIHTPTSRIYVGSAISIAKRWRHHYGCLRRNTHINPYLQKTWNKYGANAFRWIILEEISDVTQLITAEQKWMDSYQAYNPNKGFNIAPTAGSPLGRKLTEEQKKHLYSLTEQNIKDIIKRRINGESYTAIAKDYNVTMLTIGNIARRKAYTHIKISPELEQELISANVSNRWMNGSKAKASKLTETDIPVIRERLNMGETCTSISKSYNVTIALISQIKRGKAWTHIPLTELEGTATI